MAIPQTTPLLLASEYVLITNINAGSLTNINSNEALRLRNAILAASAFIQRVSFRRFDEWVDQRLYHSLDERIGGSLLGPYDLSLDADFKSFIKVVNGNGVPLTSYTGLTPNSQPGGQSVVIHSRLHLNINGGVVFQSGTNDPYNSIQVTGVLGYGGQWLSIPITVTADSGSTMTFSDGTQLEPGMVLKLTNTGVTPNTFEYIYVDVSPTVAGGNVTVGRAFNGSTMQTWASGTTVQYFQALEIVRDIVRRLVQWKLEQVKAPAASSATVGDFTFPVAMDGLPADIYIVIRDAHLMRVAGAVGV
jgi:hypothetical protein